jgi:hypothetical protein
MEPIAGAVGVLTLYASQSFEPSGLSKSGSLPKRPDIERFR